MSWRYVSSNARCAVPTQTIVVAVSTVQTADGEDRGCYRSDLRAGHAVYWRMESGEQTRRKERSFSAADEFWLWANSKMNPKQPLWIWSYRAGEVLTVLRLWEEIEQGRLGLYMPNPPDGQDTAGLGTHSAVRGLLVDRDPPTIVRLTRGDKSSLVCLDTRNWLDASLDDLGALLGASRPPHDYDESAREGGSDVTRCDALLLERCVYGLYRWTRENDLGNFRSTLAGQAMGSYRHRWAPRRAKVLLSVDDTGQQVSRTVEQTTLLCHDDMPLRRLERSAYYGGACDCYCVGHIDGPLHWLDVCGLYGSVMASYPYPRRPRRQTIATDVEDPSKLPDPTACIARVEIDSARIPWPVRVYRARGVGDWVVDDESSSDAVSPVSRLLYATGRFVTTLCGLELYSAIQAGCVRRVLGYCDYVMEDLFSRWVRHWWHARVSAERAGDSMTAMLAKRMMNSLYGKFGQLAPQWRPRPDLTPPEQWGEWYAPDSETGHCERYRSVAGNSEQYMGRREHPGSMPSISAFTTMYSRLWMETLRATAGGRHVYYQYVDSLIVDSAGLANLISADMVGPQTLGKLRICETVDHCHIHGVGWIDFGTHSMKLGVKGNAEKIGPRTWVQEQTEELHTVLGRAQDGSVKSVNMLKEMTNHSPKGHVGPDGWVTPFHLDTIS